MKRILCACLLCFACLNFAACSDQTYTDTLSCEEIANKLVSEISPSEDYKSYSNEEVGLLLDKNVEYDDCCFLYSGSSDDMSEIAVFHSAEADLLFDKLSEYADTLRSDKRSFVENYLPSELKKLDDGQARRFGNYVILAILDKSERDAVFESAKNFLSKK